MSKKLKRYLEEIERTERKIEELKDLLKNLRQAQKEEEEAEMVRTMRGLRIAGKDLMEVLHGLQDGSFVIRREEMEDDCEEGETYSSDSRLGTSFPAVESDGAMKEMNKNDVDFQDEGKEG